LSKINIQDVKFITYHEATPIAAIRNYKPNLMEYLTLRYDLEI